MRQQEQRYLSPEEEPLRARIQGLAYFSNFIDKPTHDRLVESIDMQPWEHSLKRRVQQYGHKYDYKHQTIDSTHWLGPMPDWIAQIATLLHQRGIVEAVANQVIVNEYLPGQGIASHIDRESCFGEAIAILSLGSPVVMNFIHAISKQRNECWLKPRCLVLLEGPARYQWKHGIAARKTDRFQGKTYNRGRRISLTFRRVLLDSE